MMRSRLPIRAALLALPLALALPSSAAPPDEIVVIDDKPKAAKPGKPSMRLNLSKLPDVSLASTVIRFPTGLRFVMQSDRSHPYVSVFMVVDHGNGDDPKGKDGTAHFAEHTWFRSEHGELPPVWTVIQDLGSLFNATTRGDTTDFRTVASSEYIDILMRLESLRLVEPYIGMTEEMVETEREVVRNEWRRRNEQGSNLVFDSLLKSVFPEGHPYHARETNESLDNIDLKTLQDYFDAYYRPEKSTVIVMGDFDPAEVRSLIFSNFDLQLLDPDLKPEHLVRYPRPGIEKPNPDNPKHWLTDAMDPKNTDKPYPWPDPTTYEPRITPKTPYPPLPAPPELEEIPEYEAAIDNQIVAVGWSLPGGYRGQDTELNALGYTASVFLNSQLRRNDYLDTEDVKRGLKDPGCGTLVQKVHSMMYCAIEVTDTKRWDPDRVADLMVDQLPELWNPENRTMLNRFYQGGKMQQMAGVFQSIDIVAQHFGGRAEAVGFHAHHTGRVTYHSDAINEIAALDAVKVANLGYEYLKRKRAAYAVINPIPKEDIDTSAETSSYHGASEDDVVIKGAEDVSGYSRDDIADSYIKPDLDDLQDLKLPNGMRVVVLPHGESPLVQATLVFGGGTLSQPLEALKAAEWTRTHEYEDPLQFAAFEQSGMGQNSTTRLIRTPASNLDSALWMLRNEIETSRPDFAGKGANIKKMFKEQLGNFHKRSWNISDIRSRHLYPDTPAHWPRQWENIQVRKDQTPTEARQLADRYYQPANTTLLIVGNVDAEDAKRLAVDYFAGWEAPDGVENKPAPAPPVPSISGETKVLVFDDEERTQTQVNTACRLNFDGVEDMQATAVLANVLRDRTSKQLRVTEGLAYSPFGTAVTNQDNSAFIYFGSLAVNTGVGRTVEYFGQLTKKVEDGGISADELKMYQLRRARSYGIQAQSTGQMTSKLIEPLAWDQPWSMLTDAGERVADVNTDQIKRMVEGCSGRSITTLEGPAEIITPQLEERGIAYEIVDYEARGDELHEKYDPKGYKKYAKKRAKAKAKKEAKEAADDGSADSE